jgi:hypothetical protein
VQILYQLYCLSFHQSRRSLAALVLIQGRQMLSAHCHCGNVSLSANETPDSITECNCSICGRYGARWAYFKPENVTIIIQSGTSQRYRWGDEEIDFHHCNLCGCVTHYTGTEKNGPSKRVAINTRMSPISETANIPIRHFDGADTWKYLD